MLFLRVTTFWATMFISVAILNGQNNENGFISFSPSGTLIIKTTSGEEFNAILNTVSGFPVSFYKDGTDHKLALDAFSRAEFLHQKKDEYDNTLTIRAYDNNNKETVFIKDYDPDYPIGIISFLTDKGTRFLSLNHVVRMTKNENKTPNMPENIRYAYVRSGGTTFQVPQPLLKYQYVYYGSSKDYYGIPHYNGDIFNTNLLKYIRICSEVDGFNYSSAYANVYFTDNSMISTELLPGYLVFPTTLGELNPKITEVNGIFFDNYDANFAKKVAADVWNECSKIALFTGKGTATVYKNDNGRKSVYTFSSNSLSSISNRGGVTHYLDVVFGEKGIDVWLLLFPNIKSLNIKNINNNLTAEYLLYSGETGETRITDLVLEGLTEDRIESIIWKNIEKIDFDKNRNVDLSQIKKAIITGKKGCVFETQQPMLYYSGGRTVYVKGGSSITYDKIKKIEFLPTKKEGNETLYPANITLQDGSSQEMMLYDTNLEFLTSMGWFRLNRNNIQSIEFIH